MKKELPLISICTPNYNDGKFVGEYIESIMDQDYPNIELIICDDGSTDESKKILDAKSKKHKKLKIIYSRHKGACYARNQAAKEASGKYISFLPADAVVYPGVIRTWVNHLEDNEDIDFLYGGYKFVDEETRNEVYNYMSEPFDPYMLKVANYIDGSFPLKKTLFDKMGGWDSSIKSLQDWDFWLNAVVKHDAKGMYLPEVFFETTMPHKGGLSDDSHNHWVERTRTIKKKYGIKEKDICVTSVGAPFHGKNIAKILDADYKENPAFKPHSHKLLYMVGFYPSVADRCAEAFKGHTGLRVAHWVGSDIWQLQQMSTYHKKMLIQWLDNNIDLHLTEFKLSQNELKAEGIESKILPIPPKKMFAPTPLPEKFTVAVYMPFQNQDNYMPAVLDDLTRKARNIEFKFFGDMSKGGKKGNVEYMGRLDENGMEKLISESSCLLRLCKHDGLAISTEEFLCAGRHVVTNVPDIKYTEFIAGKIDDIIAKLEQLKKKKVNKKSVQYWRKKLSHATYKKFFDNLLNYDPKEYWEMRADIWDTVQGEECFDEKKVLEMVEKINPKSIIDLGCGNGNWAAKLPDVEYLGVDISRKLINKCKKKHPFRFTIHNKQFKVGDVRDLKVDKQYDLAFAYTTFLHVPPEDMDKVKESLKGIAKQILFIEPYKKPTGGGFRMLHPDIIDEIKKGNLVYHPNSDYIHDYSKYFDIAKRIGLGSRRMYLANL